MQAKQTHETKSTTTKTLAQKHIHITMSRKQSPLSDFVKTLASTKGAISLAVEVDNSWSHQPRQDQRTELRKSIRSTRWEHCQRDLSSPLSPPSSSPTSVGAIQAIQQAENSFLSSPRISHRKMFSRQTQSQAFRSRNSCSPGEFGLTKPVRRRSWDHSLEPPLLNC